MTVICEDGRPAEQLGAIRVWAGEVPAGWLPAYEVTASDVDAAMVEYGLEWDEFGRIVAG